VRAGTLGLALAALAGCQPAPAPESAADIAVKVGPITTSSELEGIYRVADIGGIDMADLDHGFAVSIERGRIDVLANCINTHWTYRFEDARLVTAPVEDHGPCRRALMQDERAIMEAFDGAQRASRTPSNGILIEGSGPSLTLFTQ